MSLRTYSSTWLPGVVIALACGLLVLQCVTAVRDHVHHVRDELAIGSLKTVSARDSLWEEFDDMKVIGVSIDGHHRAYPQILPKHVANDAIAGVPIAVSY